MFRHFVPSRWLHPLAPLKRLSPVDLPSANSIKCCSPPASLKATKMNFMEQTNHDFWRYMEMNKEQLYAAQAAMIEWLSDPHELGKKPFKIECAGEFDFNEMHYYIFKFKASLLGKWLVGVCGGFEDDDLEPCGHIFSNMQEYNETTAKNECITMVENIMAYWKEQAAKYNNQ